MDSSNKNLVLRILLTISLVLVSEAAHESRGIPSEEEKKEMERQLKAINKPAIKSFKVGLAFPSSYMLTKKHDISFYEYTLTFFQLSLFE